MLSTGGGRRVAGAASKGFEIPMLRDLEVTIGSRDISVDADVCLGLGGTLDSFFEPKLKKGIFLS